MDYEHEISAYISGKTGVFCLAYADYEELKEAIKEFVV